MDFIANDGSYAHRGVWHITDNLKVEVIPASTTEREWKPGHHIQYIRPEHTVYKGDAICGQKDGMREGGLDWGRSRDIDDTHSVMSYRVRKANVILDIHSVPEVYRPGPLCSRCEKKAGLA